MAQKSDQLKKNSVLSLMSLFFQSGYSAILGLIANLVLTIVLRPATYGVYILVLSVISFLKYFSDIGLAASLVQKDEVSQDDFRTTFTVQILLVIITISIGFLLTSFVTKFFKIKNEDIYLYWAVLVSFFFSSLKTIPSIKLERSVQFQKIVLVQIVEDSLFYICVSVFALTGHGLQSFTYSVLIRSIVGVILMYSISFWIPSIGISIKSIKKLLSFGIPFQTNTFLALIKDDLMFIFLGKVLGLEALAYIGWAKRWAESPIRLIMDNLSRILFPIFSRLQNDKDRVCKLLEKIINYQTLLLAPIYVGMILLMHRFVYLVPKYSKWEPALPLFYLFVISAFLSSFSSPFTNLFNSLGKVKTTFKFMVYWTIMTWILVPVLVGRYGNFGFPITQVFLSLTFIPIIWVAKKYISFNFLKQITPGLLASIVMGFIINSTNFLPNQWSNLIIIVVVGGIVYISVLFSIFKINMIKEIKSIFSYD